MNKALIKQVYEIRDQAARLAARAEALLSELRQINAEIAAPRRENIDTHGSRIVPIAQ